jgi:hypothetical protein
MAVGMTVKVHGKRLATVTSVHKNGKRVGITFHDNGNATFTATANCAAI